jgi:hypothetical protein
MEATKIQVIKSKTNAGELAKIVVVFLRNEKKEDAILIVKNVLTEKEGLFHLYCQSGFAVGRAFKGKVLMQQRVSIKISTFEKINKSINKFFEDENQYYRNR